VRRSGDGADGGWPAGLGLVSLARGSAPRRYGKFPPPAIAGHAHQDMPKRKRQILPNHMQTAWPLTRGSWLGGCRPEHRAVVRASVHRSAGSRGRACRRAGQEYCGQQCGI
jgi:hypothetical protein